MTGSRRLQVAIFTPAGRQACLWRAGCLEWTTEREYDVVARDGDNLTWERIKEMHAAGEIDLVVVWRIDHAPDRTVPVVEARPAHHPPDEG